MLAVLQKTTGPEVLLAEQFRAPTGKAIIELPAGLVDGGETVEVAGLWEVREETSDWPSTGYLVRSCLCQMETVPSFQLGELHPVITHIPLKSRVV
ncbi:hypothetical protein GGR57DRAFT_464587 [Xylariaceae sp. FL1272]|nr:hypothetical protein GGR57DRAFT_464587 [Xylariaceae sp. FL1272]